MKTFSSFITLLCLLAVLLSGQTVTEPPLQEQMGVWLNPKAAAQSRLDTFIALIRRNEFQGALLQSHATKPKAVSDALTFSFENGQPSHQYFALYWTLGVQDRSCYSRMIEPALRSPSHEMRSLALGTALHFDDRSELVVSSIVAEIGSTNLSNARGTASQLAVKWNLTEAIEPLLSLVTHTNVTWASLAAGSLSAYAYLPPDALPKLEAALARAEFKATNMVRYTNTALIPPQSHAWAVDGLVVALRKAKEKAQTPPPPGMEPSKTPSATKKPRTSAVDGKTAPTGSPVAEKDSPTSTASSGGTGQNNLLLLLGLASIAVIAWFLLKGRGH